MEHNNRQQQTVTDEITKSTAVAEIADRTVLEMLGLGNLRARGRCIGGWKFYCRVLWGHFLFTCSDTFAIGCVI